MKRLILFVFILLILSSCSGRYSQHYDAYEKFNAANGRNKGWFPKLVPEDAFQLKNDSFLSKHLTFSTYRYENQEQLDSLITALNYTEISDNTFRQLLDEYSKSRPQWFITDEELDSKHYKIYKLNRENLLVDVNRKLVFCVAKSNHLS